MIQKRYQRYTREGIIWTDWFDYTENDSRMPSLQKTEKYQLDKKLLNEFRIV